MNGLLAPDAALPQRDRLLDTDAVARLLAATLGTDGPLPVGPCERVRADYRFGKRLRVLLRFRTGSGWAWITGRAFPDGQAEEAFRRAGAVASTARGGLRGVVHATDLGALFWTFPNDRKLVSLAAVLRDASALARDLGGPGARARVLGYKPEKSLVLALLEPSGRAVAYVKVHQDGVAEQAGRIHAFLARQLEPDDRNLALAAPLTRAGSGQTLVLDAVDGRRVADLAEAEAATGTALLGTALAAFHALAPPADVPRFTRHEPARLAEAAGLLARACPNVGRQAQALAAQLVRRFEPSPDPLVCLHGDVHAKNGILAGDRVALIDLDKVCLGEPAADLGSFLSLLRYERLVGGLPDASAVGRAAAFLAGYARRRPLPAPRALHWHAAAAMLAEQATRAVRQVRPAALARLDRLLDDARRLLEEDADA